MTDATPGEADVVHLRVETAPYPQQIECPACGTEIRVLILGERTAGIGCVDCGAEIRYDHGGRSGTDDGTEQTKLLPDGGQELSGDGEDGEVNHPGIYDRWPAKADLNEAKWGEQDVETLLLAMQEELGELTQAHLEARAEGADPRRIEEELDDLAALCIQLHRRVRR